MKVSVTEEIQSLCKQCSQDQHVSNEVRSKADQACTSGAIEWNDLKVIATTQQKPDSKIWLHELCSGGSVVLPTPPPKTGKSPELQAHLDKLQRQLDQKRYDAMVKDVTEAERKAQEEAESGGLKTYKQQMSYGVHVVAMMAAFYLFGQFAGRAITDNRAYHPAVGLVFMFAAMLLETVLFIIRSTKQQSTLLPQPENIMIPRNSQTPIETIVLLPKGSSLPSISSRRAATSGLISKEKQWSSTTADGKKNE